MRSLGEYISMAGDKLSDNALKVIKGANKFSPLDKYPLLKASKRLFVDVAFNKPCSIVVDSKKRLDALKATGLSEEKIGKLIVAHAICDMTIPLVCMALIRPLLTEIQDLGIFGELGATYVIGRAGYGIVAGLSRELAYSILPSPNQE